MTDIFNEVTAALSNRNTSTNAIIWTNAKASWSKKNRSRCGGHHSRRRYSRRKKQRTPISKDTATLFKKKSSGGSRRRRSRRKKQKRELTLELNSNGLLVNKAPTKSKHARGPLFSKGNLAVVAADDGIPVERGKSANLLQN